ncbi:Hypp8577 [Branchiostoma lanceolatum]|uniref:Hypp8577 protein n=1 Tax=Branchiostoma lanceolatum TaxID=7740 RepID=A0A8J9Z7M5_BRALA|nr:Hypp8577 [Branchiostoma lanceolatum]
MLSSHVSRAVALTGAAGVVVGVVAGLQQRHTDEFQAAALGEFSRPSYNPPPATYDGPVFKPRLDFPSCANPRNEAFPWLGIDFKAEPERYLRTVQDYCLEGNVECDFKVEQNRTRDWYHVPWMSSHPKGREPIHGMTMEKPSKQGMLSDSQRREVQNWAVAFYNSPGAYAVGRVWSLPWQPTQDGVAFPEGTVAFKWFFTQATEEEVPFLKGAPVWKAAIAKTPREPGDRGPPVDTRLIQMDVAIRDDRADIGWVFGTFVYHSSQSSDAPWRRLVPVCLQWGNDPDLTQQRYQEGARPVQTWNNPRLRDLGILAASRPYLGWLGRANGPVDNFKSCCASCHSTASVPDKDNKIPRGVPPNADQALRWFRNLRPGQAFEKGGTSLDYSLQLSSCTTQYNNWKKSYLQNTLLGTLKEWWLEVHPFPTTAPPSGKND